MRDDQARLARLAVIAGLLLIAGCAPLSEAQKEAREYRRVEYEAQFLMYRADCHARGGRVYIMANQKVGRDGVPSPGDRYVCG